MIDNCPPRHGRQNVPFVVGPYRPTIGFMRRKRGEQPDSTDCAYDHGNRRRYAELCSYDIDIVPKLLSVCCTDLLGCLTNVIGCQDYT